MSLSSNVYKNKSCKVYNKELGSLCAKLVTAGFNNRGILEIFIGFTTINHSRYWTKIDGENRQSNLFLVKSQGSRKGTESSLVV